MSEWFVCVCCVVEWLLEEVWLVLDDEMLLVCFELWLEFYLVGVILVKGL